MTEAGLYAAIVAVLWDVVEGLSLPLTHLQVAQLAEDLSMALAAHFGISEDA